MAEVLVQELSGTEVIEDILSQIKRKLHYSCDLRDTDRYGEGYSAEIDLRIKLYAVDTIVLHMTVNIPAKADPPVSTEEVTVTPIEISEKIEIPQELDLESVRARSSMDMSGNIQTPEVNEAEENRMPARLKRKYARRLPMPETPAQGGAVDVTDE